MCIATKDHRGLERRHLRPRKVTARRKADTMPKKRSEHNSGCFESVLSRPFLSWNDLETMLGEYEPRWGHTHRSFIVLNLVRYLELKVLTEQYADDSLLAPTTLVSRAWQALILETALYKRVVYDIQEFHGQAPRMLHYSKMKHVASEAYKERLDRTQRLFQCYYGEAMTETFDDIYLDLSMTDTSALTEANINWQARLLRCEPLLRHTDVATKIPEKIFSKPQLHKKSSKLSNTNPLSILSRVFCWDAVRDSFLCGGDESSLEATVILDDIDNDNHVFTSEFMRDATSPIEVVDCAEEYSPSLLTPVFSWD